MLFYCLCTFLLFLITYYLYERKRKYETFWKYIYAIPGEPYNPIVGNTQGYGKTAAELFYILWDGSKIHSSICMVWFFNCAFVYLMDPKDIEIVLSSTKHHSKGKFYEFLQKWLGTGLLTSSGAKWQYRRKILTKSFHFSILQTFVGIFNSETDNLVNSLKKCPSEKDINILEPITEFTLNSIGETSLGINMKLQATRNQYKNAVYTFGDHFTYVTLRPWLINSFMYNLSSLSKKVDRAITILHDLSMNIIRKRKLLFKSSSNSGERRKVMALLDILLESKYDRKIIIDDEGIREEVDTFMFAGHDTTALALTYLLMTLANESKWQEEIFKEIQTVLGDDDNKHPTFQQLNEMKLMERCIKENLRLYPSVPLITRIADENFKTTTGYIIPKGTNVNIPIFYMHRSDKVWENPEKFDPDRFLPENSAKRHPFAFVPFSAGPRNCIGQRFAMLEMKTALCGILRNFILEPGIKPEEIVFKFDLTLRSINEITVKLIPRVKSYEK